MVRGPEITMERPFDYLALPRGQAPGGPVQSSDGRWYLVIPATLELDQAIQWMMGHRKGRPVGPEEMARAVQRLSQ